MDPKAQNLLLIDPALDAATIKKLARYFKKIHTAQSAQNALEIYQTEHINIILTALNLGAQNGIALIQKIRALDAKNGTKTPIIIIEQNATTKDLLSLLPLGIASYLFRPLSTSELLTSIRAIEPEKRSEGGVLERALNAFLDANKKRILSYMRERANANGIYYGSLLDIAAATGLSKVTVIAAMKKFEQSGVVWKVKNKVYKLVF